jgi:hypothetical protein
MHRLRAFAAGILVVATASAAAVAQGATAVGTGDACGATGTGTQYTLTVQLPSNAPQQDGFAVGVPGGKVTTLTVGGVPGQAPTNLPAGTDAAWLMGTPQGVAGAEVTVNIQATVQDAKSFTVVPHASQDQTWLAPITCAVSKTSAAAEAITVGGQFAYDSASHSWHLSVTVPGPGTVIVSQLGGAKLLLTSRAVKATQAGTTRVTLIQTKAGRAAFAMHAMLHLRLRVQFLPVSAGMAPSTKTLTLTLRR